jgi:hypothetical protein
MVLVKGNESIVKVIYDVRGSYILIDNGVLGEHGKVML